MKREIALAAVVGLTLVLAPGVALAKDLYTTYGEDPVPSTYRSLEPPYTAYGMDPIPVKSPLERWDEYRAYRMQKLQARESTWQSEGYWPRWRRRGW